MAAGHLDVPDLGGGSVAAVHDCEELFLPLVAQIVGPVGKTVVMTKGSAVEIEEHADARRRGSCMGEDDSGTTAEMVRA
jgi:hypothetical protein